MYVVIGTDHNLVLLWDAETGAEPTTAPAPLMSLAGHDVARGPINWTCCAFSPDSARLATGSYDTTARLWDAATGAPAGEPLAGHTQWVTASFPEYKVNTIPNRILHPRLLRRRLRYG